jgi:hypothetical protein
MAGGGDMQTGPITRTFGERDTAELKNVTFDTQLSGYVGSEGLNWGASEACWLDTSVDELRVTLLRFDLSSIPTDAVVEDATLSLFTHTDDLAFSDDPTRIFEVLEAWDEGNGSGDPGVANWYDRMNGVPWTSPGCGVGSRSDTELASFTATATGSEYVFALPLDLIGRWVADPDGNHGIVLLTYSTNGTGIASSESTLLNHRPMMTVTYEP